MGLPGDDLVEMDGLSQAEINMSSSPDIIHLLPAPTPQKKCDSRAGGGRKADILKPDSQMEPGQT